LGNKIGATSVHIYKTLETQLVTTLIHIDVNPESILKSSDGKDVTVAQFVITAVTYIIAMMNTK
jgi:hypothetical protein